MSKKPLSETHDNPLCPRLNDEDHAFLIAEADRIDIPKNVLARQWLRAEIQRIKKERQDAFKRQVVKI